MTGADRYSDAVAFLISYRNRSDPQCGDPRLLAEAQVNATLALAAATALNAILPVMGGDSEEVTAWAKLIAPDLTATGRPDRHPPLRDVAGEVWLWFDGQYFRPKWHPAMTRAQLADLGEITEIDS